VTRVGLLECDHVDDRYVGIGGDYADMFEALLPSVDLVRYDAINGALPARPDECDGWVATGSRFSAYDDAAWISALGAFVREVHDADIPFVGICFGHQVLAHFTGGRCEKAATGWGVGAHDLVSGEAARLLYLHQDQVTALPPDGVTVASADHCPNAVITVGARMLGIQAHPEFPGEYVEALLHAREERIGHDVVEAALASLDAPRDEDVAAAWMLRTLG
jgi:GMP synthase-like glutamine amidotransferase